MHSWFSNFKTSKWCSSEQSRHDHFSELLLSFFELSIQGGSNGRHVCLNMGFIEVIVADIKLKFLLEYFCG